MKPETGASIDSTSNYFNLLYISSANLGLLVVWSTKIYPGFKFLYNFEKTTSSTSFGYPTIRKIISEDWAISSGFINFAPN